MGNLVIEGVEALLYLTQLGTNLVTVVFQQFAACFGSRGTLFTQLGISTHLAQRHPCGLQPSEKFDPDQNGEVIMPLPGRIPIDTRQQTDTLVIPQRISRQSGFAYILSNFHHKQPIGSDNPALQSGVYSRSSGVVMMNNKKGASVGWPLC